MLNKRTQILFDENLWIKLVKLAAAKKTSVGNLVREAVREQYTEEVDLEKQRRILEEIEVIRPHFRGKLDYKAMINYGRKY